MSMKAEYCIGRCWKKSNLSACPKFARGMEHWWSWSTQSMPDSNGCGTLWNFDCKSCRPALKYPADCLPDYATSKRLALVSFSTYLLSLVSCLISGSIVHIPLLGLTFYVALTAWFGIGCFVDLVCRPSSSPRGIYGALLLQSQIFCTFLIWYQSSPRSAGLWWTSDAFSVFH